MTNDEAKALKVGDWVTHRGTLGSVAEVQPDAICIAWRPATTSWHRQWIELNHFEKIELAHLPIWYQPVHYMHSCGGGWKIVQEKVIREYPNMLLLESGRYVHKQGKGKFPYFRTYELASKRLVELLIVAQAKEMARYLRKQDAADALIERLNAEAPDVP